LKPTKTVAARRRVSDGGDGLQIWRVAANKLSKQSREADKGWSSRLGMGEAPTTHHRKETACYEMSRRASDLTVFCEQGNETNCTFGLYPSSGVSKN
jgi:hypothetical protein